MRHPEPAIVIHYRATINTEPPRVCHTCDHYTEQGLCEKFDSEPPVEFASEPGGCAFYEEEVPF